MVQAGGLFSVYKCLHDLTDEQFVHRLAASLSSELI